MKKILSIVSCLILCTTIASAQVSINTLSKKEEKQGWQLLFNGKNLDRKSTRLNSSHPPESRMPSSA